MHILTVFLDTVNPLLFSLKIKSFILSLDHILWHSYTVRIVYPLVLSNSVQPPWVIQYRRYPEWVIC